MPTTRTFIVGVGCTKFVKPRGQRTAEDMGLEAATKALLDAGITYDLVQHAFVGYCYGDSCTGQRALYALGMTGIPITNVNNNCATGSVALYHANSYVSAGIVECALALGIEQMSPGSLKPTFADRPPPLQVFNEVTHVIEEREGGNIGPMAPRMFSNAAQEYFDKYGATKKHLAMISAKNHAHSTRNPYSQFQNSWSVDQILNSPDITKQSTKLMCCPTSDGAACCIVASEAFVHTHNLENQAVEIVAQALGTDDPGALDSGSAMELVGFNMTRRLADAVFETAGVTRQDIGVVELHDCFAANELVTYDALRLCAEGDAHKFVERGDNTYGGKYVVNPSGGLEAKGHPLGATGLGMHFYITNQLRGWAGPMQVPNLAEKYGLVHNLGLGGACVVSLLKRPDFWKDGGEDGRIRVGYNHAHECRSVTMSDVDNVKSRKASRAMLERVKL